MDTTKKGFSIENRNYAFAHIVIFPYICRKKKGELNG